MKKTHETIQFKVHKKKICLFLMKAISQNRQFPIHWKQFSVRRFISILTRMEILSKRDGPIPAKIAKRNTTEHQGPKGNFCLTSILLPRVPLYSLLPPPCIFPFFPALFPIQEQTPLHSRVLQLLRGLKDFLGVQIALLQPYKCHC